MANGDDKAYDLALDDFGNVYVAGESEDYGTDSDYAIVKYDAEGNEIWVERYNGPDDEDDIANALAVDSNGNVFVTGLSCGSSQDAVTIKYSQCVDADVDGFSDEACGGQDCDDLNPSINPLAQEICDGIDNNCSSEIDEEPFASGSCDDSLFCDGVEFCSEGSCQYGIEPCPDDDLFCTGVESCDEVQDQCVASGDPCVDGSECTEDVCDEDLDDCENPCIASGPDDLCCEDPACVDNPICIPFTMALNASYAAGYLSLDFTLGTPEPAAWATFMILTSPAIRIIPLWSIQLPITDPPIEIPLTFHLPSLGLVGFHTGLYTEEGEEVSDRDWVIAE